MKKFITLYNKVVTQARGYLTNKDLEEYPIKIRQQYYNFNDLRKTYYRLKYNKLKQLGFSPTQNSEIQQQIINVFLTSFNKLASDQGTFKGQEKQQEKQIKAQLIQLYNNEKIPLQTWKKLAIILKELKKDPQLKSIYRNLLLAYDKLPGSMKELIDMPDKSNLSVLDEIIYQKQNKSSYHNAYNNDITGDTVEKYIKLAESFDIRPILEQNVYSLLNRQSGKLFVIKYVTSTGKQLTRVGKLHITNAVSKLENGQSIEYNVKNPLEASRRLSEYNNITYYDLSSLKPGYRNAKLSNVISVSLGDFEKGEGLTYIVKH